MTTTDGSGRLSGLVCWRYSNPPRTVSPLASQIADVSDRSAILAAATMTLDRHLPAMITDTSGIGAHVAENMRLIDNARNWAKGSRHSSLQADLLEAAIVAHNVLLPALGLEVASPIVQNLETHLKSLVDDAHPCWRGGGQDLNDATAGCRSQMAAYQASDPYRPVLASAATSSLPSLREATRLRCVALLSDLRKEYDAADPFGEARDTASTADATDLDGQVAAVSAPPLTTSAAVNDGDVGDGDDDGNQEAGDWDGDLEDGGGGDDDGDGDDTFMTTPMSLDISSRRMDGLVGCIAALESAAGRVLPRGAGNRLPHLFLPQVWSDGQILGFADAANERADLCNDARPTPQCKPSETADKDPVKDEDGGPPQDSWTVESVRNNRSAATLLLAWVRLALEEKLSRCSLTGLELVFSTPGTRSHHPLRPSLVAHQTHGWPIDYGWSTRWPSTLQDFDSGHVNVTVQS